MFSTEVSKKTEGGKVAKRENLQFSKDKLTDFGDLPLGKVPEALEFDLPSNISYLKNGVKVASEAF